MEAEITALCPDLGPLAVARVKRPPRTLLPEDLPAYGDATLAAVEPFRDRRFDVVIYGCTAAGFLAGPEGNARMVDRLCASTGSEVISTADAMVDSLKSSGVASAAIVTPYLPPVNDGLRAYLESYDIAVEVLASFLCKTTEELGRITDRQVLDLALKTMTPRSAALFIACSQLPTLDAVAQLRARIRIPVWSSVQATAWSAVRALSAQGKPLRLAAVPARAA